MSDRLLIMRHATADEVAPGGDDAERALVGRGLSQCSAVGAWLRRRRLIPDVIVHSPYRRARETAVGVAEQCGALSRLRSDVRLVPGGPLAAAMASIAETPGRLTLVIGHEPQLSALIARLIGDGAALIGMRKAAVAELEWLERHPPRAELLGLLRPGYLD